MEFLKSLGMIVLITVLLACGLAGLGIAVWYLVASIVIYVEAGIPDINTGLALFGFVYLISWVGKVFINALSTIVNSTTKTDEEELAELFAQLAEEVA